MSKKNPKSNKAQVANRKAGSATQKNTMLSKKQFQALSQGQRSALVSRTRPLGSESTSVAAAYSSPVRNNRPKIVYGANARSCRVVHKEFIQNIVGTANFTVPVFLPLNPGLQTSFPWLSNIANNFEQYRVNMLRFCYLTRTGTNIPGSVLMAPDYDAADAQPSSEQIMSNYSEIVEDAPWKDMCCVLRPSGMHALGPKKFVRSGVVQGQDIKTTDVGTFILATVDGTAVSWGKLWVEYDIEFFEPQLNPGGQPIVGVAFGTSGTAAAVISAGLVLAGPYITGIAGNIVSFSGLLIGNEYLITCGSTTPGAVVLTFSAQVGCNVRNTLFATSTGPAAYGQTLTATANSGSVTITLGGNATNVLISFCAIPSTLGI